MKQLLGAINKKTGEYIYPKIANKKDDYSCPDCDKNLIFCHGKVKVPYFRHCVDEYNPCNYYDKPNESQIHKDGKLLMKKLLEDKTEISLVRKCISCDGDDVFDIKEMGDTSKIKIEYTFEYNGKKIADVAYVDDNKIKYIFEICNTHKTDEEKRPEPWFEIDALTLINKANENYQNSLKISCIRCKKCSKCIEKYNIVNEKKIAAKSILLKWLNDSIDDDYLYIKPFMAVECDVGSYLDVDSECIFDLFDQTINDIADVVIFHKMTPRYILHLCYSKEKITKYICIDEYCISICYISIDWILKQKNMPTEIKFVDGYGDYFIYDSKYNNIKIICINESEYESMWIDTNKCIYFDVPFSDKELIKLHDGKWNNECKKWYVYKNSKSKDFLWKTYTQIIFHDSNCDLCDGTGIIDGEQCGGCFKFLQ